MKKFFRALGLVLLSVIVLFSVYAIASGRTYLFEAVWDNFADIDDYKIFSNNTVVSGTPQPWQLSADYNKPAMPADLKKLLKELSTIGVLVVKEDALLYEQYWDGYSDSSVSGSFSMAKSITSLLIGAALKDGSIKSVNEPVGNYLYEFSHDEKLKLKNC